MSDLFISYASADKDKAELIAKAFAKQGWSIWWDRQIPPGKSFDEVIEQALHRARCVIVLWSKESVSSRWVKTEAAEAAARGILVPALIDNVQIPLEFKRIEAANLTDWEHTSPHVEFDQLLKTISGILADNTSSSSPIITSTNTRPHSRPWWKSLPIIIAAISTLFLLAGIAFALFKLEVFQKAADTPESTAISPAEVANETKSGSPKAVQYQTASTSQAIETATQSPLAQTPVKLNNPINLLAAENDGQLLVASSDDWAATIDGKEDFTQINYGLGKEAVYAFKGEQAATFDTFTMLISETSDYNVKEFELLVGNESPTGNFESVGKYQIQNVKLFKTPYQEFKFPAVTAKYFKVKVLSTQGGYSHPNIHEFQLFGRLE